VANADGSVDIYFFAPKAPAGKEANWIQTVASLGRQVLSNHGGSGPYSRRVVYQPLARKAPTY
jgi:hypothetical protein